MAKMSATKLGKTSTTNYGEQVREPYFQEYTNYPTTLIKIEASTGKLHPTEKPVELFEYLIKTFTNKNMLILDNCVGSGTAAIAAKKNKRNFICIEKEQAYCDMAQKRLEEFAFNKQEATLFDAKEGLNRQDLIPTLFQ